MSLWLVKPLAQLAQLDRTRALRGVARAKALVPKNRPKPVSPPVASSSTEPTR